MKCFSLITSMLLVWAMSSIAVHAIPLVDAAWVAANLGKPGIVYLDVTGNPKA